MEEITDFKFNPEDMTELYTLYKSDLDYIRVLKQNANNVFLQENGGGGSGGSVAWADVTGKPATFAPTIGTTATTAKAGNYQPTAANISDASAVGRSVLTAADAAAARSAIGAGTGNGTSNLVIGTTSTTAKAGDYQPTWAQVSGKPTTFAPVVATATVTGGVKAAASQADSVAVDVETLVTDFNSLLAKLKAAGIML